ncbi:MAG: TonB-dependent receptor [Bacteroidales bacterium]|jgi:outer membrane receptor for ferrienterochelin and colicin|nr:TonB-dependent receptor [Bacteroidales bacterium]
MKRAYYLSIVLLTLATLSQAQSYTISGFVSDAKSGENLIYASVYDEKTNTGCITNEYGYFSLILKQADVELVVSYVGYNSHKKSLKLSDNLKLNIALDPVITLGEVLVTDKKADEMVRSSQMSMIEMPIQKIKMLPVLLGEADVMKSLQLLPGVQSGQEGASGIYVRGGGPDQNLILLDGVPVYNADHLFGFFSVFNPDAISSVKLIKGGFPARYGGRLSSVVDIRMKEGNLKEWHGSGSVGNVASKLTIEGPIIKDKTGFLISGRRTYIDLLARPIIKATNVGDVTAGYFFHDLNTKVHHKLGEDDKLFLSLYTGRDKAYSNYSDRWIYDNVIHDDESKNELFWGNLTTALRWNHVFGPHVFANTTLVFSDYRFSVLTSSDHSENEVLTESYKSEFVSGIQDVGGSIDLDLNWFPKHKMKSGLNYLYHTFKPGVSAYSMKVDEAEINQDIGNNPVYANEYSLYFEDNWTMTERLQTNMGLHYSGFVLKNSFYHSLQPRISSRFMITEKLSVKAAYARMQQYLHLLTNSTIGLPTDLWMPCTDSIPPQLSDQVALGLSWNINNMWDMSVEGFYKEMNNLIAYKEGASFFDVSQDWEDKIEIGDGWSYGVELLVRKNYGKFSGWIGYTMSWSWRQFDNLNFGEKYPYKYDRRHDISIAMTYKHSDEMDFGFTWVYGTGNAITLALARYAGYSSASGDEYYYSPDIEYYDSKNAYRMPAYHKMDFAANFHKEKKWGTRTWSLGLYNAYNRQNPFYLFFGTDWNGNRQLKQLSLFPAIPFVRYSFIF